MHTAGSDRSINRSSSATAADSTLIIIVCKIISLDFHAFHRNVKHAQSAIWISWPLSSLMSLGLCFTGLAIYTRYCNCDPLESGRIGSYDQLMPLYVMDMLSAYPGVPGLFIAGIFSAGLSTISATVNSLAAVILEDFIKPICRLW